MMDIVRHGITDGANGLPIISRALVRGDTVYLCGVTPDPAGDIKAQTKQVLDRIESSGRLDSRVTELGTQRGGQLVPLGDVQRSLAFSLAPFLTSRSH